jgi:hypothetical protein
MSSKGWLVRHLTTLEYISLGNGRNQKVYLAFCVHSEGIYCTVVPNKTVVFVGVISLFPA